MSKLRAVYVTQYGAWWRLTPQQWRELCEEGAKGEGYELPPKNLQRRPGSIVGAEKFEDGGEAFYARGPHRKEYLIAAPLDWEPYDFEAALRELAAPEPQR